MYDGYKELENLAPEKYLNWQNFATPWDNLPIHREQKTAEIQYLLGLTLSKEHIDGHISIAYNGTWGAWKPNSSTVSYEGIGYHACTKDLLHGFLDGPAPLIVHRWNGESKRIK